MFLNEEQLSGLQAKYGKVGSVVFAGHQLVFRKPTRDEARNYRRERESNEKHDALEHLAQFTIVAFDGVTDPVTARSTYTGVFLEEYPMFANGIAGLLGVLSGLVESEDDEALGKGVRLWTGRQKISPEASQNGSPTAPGEPTSQTMPS